MAEAQDLGGGRIERISPALDAAVGQAMAPEPGDRPADVATFADQLSAGLIADEVTQRIDLRAAAAPAPKLEAAAASAPVLAPVDEPSPIAESWNGREPVVVAPVGGRSSSPRSIATPLA